MFAGPPLPSSPLRILAPHPYLPSWSFISTSFSCLFFLPRWPRKKELFLPLLDDSFDGPRPVPTTKHRSRGLSLQESSQLPAANASLLESRAMDCRSDFAALDAHMAMRICLCAYPYAYAYAYAYALLPPPGKESERWIHSLSTNPLVQQFLIVL